MVRTLARDITATLALATLGKVSILALAKRDVKPFFEILFVHLRFAFLPFTFLELCFVHRLKFLVTFRNFSTD